MAVRITGHHVEMTEQIKNYIEKEIARLDKFFDGIIDTEVILRQDTKHNHLKEAEILIKVYEHKLTAKATDPDILKAFDKSLTKVERQLIKFKDKLKSHR
ncbi:MAG: ribosome-associated translation inhibitor RaiA [Candidatus Kryptonium sp.]|nr:ribosome-associated translation inhibitor RaiA [Candidatus Kryptonium sp.]MCX7762046.1 ribosome-associated translation inhibitor RaiA [Candidatus Kryptonium sp.]MDW8108350.1 ribosome-associated translation inhibitor RaiA [Candidatus Kryptonium sp.]